MEVRKLPSLALFLTVFGALLLMPPLVLLFTGPTRLLGIPAEIIYLFAVWLGLIICTGLIAVRLPRTPPPDEVEGER